MLELFFYDPTHATHAVRSVLASHDYFIASGNLKAENQFQSILFHSHNLKRCYTNNPRCAKRPRFAQLFYYLWQSFASHDYFIAADYRNICFNNTSYAKRFHFEALNYKNKTKAMFFHLLNFLLQEILTTHRFH